MITATNKRSGDERTFTADEWNALEQGGHDRNWTDIRVTPDEPPKEVAHLIEKKPDGKKAEGAA